MAGFAVVSFDVVSLEDFFRAMIVVHNVKQIQTIAPLQVCIAANVNSI
jgi:hypothetical protein